MFSPSRSQKRLPFLAELPALHVYQTHFFQAYHRISSGWFLQFAKFGGDGVEDAQNDSWRERCPSPPKKKKSFVGDFRPQVIQTSGGLFGDPWAATTKGVHPFSWVPLKVIPPFVQATNHTTSPLLSPQTKHTPKLQGTRSTKPRCAKVFACGEVACGKITLRKPQRRYP